MPDYGVGQIIIGTSALGAAAGIMRRVLAGRKQAAAAHPPSASASASIEQGVRLLEAGMMEIKTAVAGIPGMQRSISLQGADILVLQHKAHVQDADLQDVRREAEEMRSNQRGLENRIRRLERDAQGD
jgi:hypothetical protein